jgi:creatinine amidohydrolase
MLLALSTWPEIEEYLGGNKGIIIPVGSTEQHGPTGLIGTDYITATAMAEACGERKDFLVSPPITVGMAQHHMAFPGTITLRPATFINVIVDWITSLSKHGFRRIYFINGHGGNIAPIITAFNEFYASLSLRPKTDTSKTLCKLVNWWAMPETDGLIKDIFAEADGVHATASEIAITQYIHPESIKPVSKDMAPAKGGAATDIHNAYDYRTRFIDGRIGSDVRAANPKDGEIIFKQAVSEIADDCASFFQS